MRAPLRLTLVLSLTLAGTTAAQESQGARTPISIGDYPNVNGLRLNFRDSDLGRVNGMNVTIWTPYEPMSGTVRGIALGLPATGARDIAGLATGIFGVGASHDITGIVFGPIGAGAGHRIKGIGVGGIGLGAGGDVEGIALGGIGVGSGGDARGLLLGGIGAGAAGRVTGLAAGLIGVGSGSDVHGAVIGGIGAGTGGDLIGFGFGGIGIGAAGRVKGVMIGGVGVGSGSSVEGIVLGGIGVGAPEIRALAIAGAAVGGERVHGVVLTPGMLLVENDGDQRGLSVNAVGSRIKGTQHGLVIGLVNYARSVDGLQVGLINIIDRATSHRVLPFVNWQD